MLNANLAGTDRRIWDLHAQGFAPSAIASIVGTGEDATRAVIVGAWLDDKLAAKAAKRKRAA